MRSFFYGLVITIVCLLVSADANAQPWFNRWDSIPVTDASGNPLINAWAGGLNFCQFSELDMDMDGIKDLFVFDRTGNKIVTFLNGGTPGTVDYHHTMLYNDRFPPLKEWALLVDYNCDGKEDIFTYSGVVNGISVYRNTSTVSGGLNFTLQTTLIYTDDGTVTLPLAVSAVDLPAISDIDNDGDLDIITFEASGIYVEYHKNQSMELYGTCDSLTFIQKNKCWGYFSENFSNNTINLNDPCPGNVSNPETETRHGGSCSLCMDIDGDNDKDILLGDLSHSNLVLVTNGGSSSAANMTAVSYNFPSNSVAVSLQLFPCGFYLDVDNDSIRDLIVSPNISNASQNFTSNWFYKNTGTNSNPVFVFQQNNFLQEEMIETGEGAYPVFFDHNADGLLDIIIGNFNYYGQQGKLSLYENVGTASNPAFKLITRDYANISSLNIQNAIPAFGDLDGDNDDDLIIGAFDGKIHYFSNTASASTPANFVLSQPNYQGIDVGSASSPQIIDVDRDGLNDLLIGETAGNINYYRNTGTASAPVFTLITSSFGGIDVMIPCCTGYSYPFMFEDNGNYKLFVGSEKGYLYYYDNIDGNLSGNFNLVDSMYLDAYEGARIGINGADVTADGYMDLLVGNFSGGPAFYKGSAVNSVASINSSLAFEMFPNPANNEIIINTGANRSGFHLEIRNMIGQQVMELESHASSDVINVSTMSPGIYICRVTTMEGNRLLIGYQKLVLQR